MNKEPDVFTAKYLTVEQVMEILGVSRSTIHNWTCSKQITYYKFGKTLRFKESDIAIFIDSRCRKAM